MNRNFVVPLCVVFQSAAACLLARTSVSLLLIFFDAFWDNEIFEGMNFKAAVISTTSAIFSNHIFVDWYWFCVDYYFNQYSEVFFSFAKVFVCVLELCKGIYNEIKERTSWLLHYRFFTLRSILSPFWFRFRWHNSNFLFLAWPLPHIEFRFFLTFHLHAYSIDFYLPKPQKKFRFHMCCWSKLQIEFRICSQNTNTSKKFY